MNVLNRQADIERLNFWSSKCDDNLLDKSYVFIICADNTAKFNALLGG